MVDFLKGYLSGSIESSQRFLRQEHIYMVGIASMIGFLVGIAAVVFKWMISYVHELLYHGALVVDFSQWSLSLLVIPVLLALGGLIVGVLNHYFNPLQESAAVSEAMKWAAVEHGKVPSRIIWFRSVASAITIGSGGSAGREGPMVQIGAAIGSLVGRWLKASSERVRLLLGCGTAASIAAAFNAPLGGIIFSIELILGDFNIKVFSPLIFSSVIATVTARHIEGDVPVFELPAYVLVSKWEILFYLILGLCCGALAALFYRMYFFSEDFFKKLKVHPIFLPVLGGFVVGFIGIFFPDILGNGYESMDLVLTGEMAWTLAISLIFVKIVATSITIGSQGSGGIYAPSLFIGSMAGGAFGVVLHTVFPGITGPSGAYALVGMGAVMSAAAHAPLTNILMVFELTNSYQIILPIMIACISSTFVYSYTVPNSIYMEKLRRRGITIWEGRESSIMAAITVGEVMTQEYRTIPENMPFKEILELIAHSEEMYYPTVDEEGRMTGILSIHDIREFMFEFGLGDIVVAKELAHDKVITLFEDENLNDAMEKFAIRDLDELPVVTRESRNRIIGVIKRKDVIATYKKAVLKSAI